MVALAVAAIYEESQDCLTVSISSEPAFSFCLPGHVSIVSACEPWKGFASLDIVNLMENRSQIKEVKKLNGRDRKAGENSSPSFQGPTTKPVQPTARMGDLGDVRREERVVHMTSHSPEDEELSTAYPGSNAVKQSGETAAEQNASATARMDVGKQRDLEQRLLMYARRLQDASPNPEGMGTLNSVPEVSNPFSIQMPLNRTVSRLSVPVAVEVLAEVEKDASNVANNLVQLMATLRTSLADVTQCSLEHLECHNDAARDLHEAVVDAASSGNRFISECQRLDQAMKGVPELASQIKAMRQLVDHFEGQLNRSLPSR